MLMSIRPKLWNKWGASVVVLHRHSSLVCKGVLLFYCNSKFQSPEKERILAFQSGQLHTHAAHSTQCWKLYEGNPVGYPRDYLQDSKGWILQNPYITAWCPCWSEFEIHVWAPQSLQTILISISVYMPTYI